MSLSSALSNAVSGLTVSAKRAQIVSTNIANASVDGFARRELDTSSGLYGGVQADGVTRVVNTAIQADRRLSEAEMEGHSDSAAMLSRLETVIGMADSDTSLSNLITAVETSLITASADPSSDIALADVVTKLSAVTSALVDNSDAVQSLRADADADIAAQVDTLNASLTKVDELNEQIVRMSYVGGDASNLMDQRQSLIDTIGQIVPIKEVDRGSGAVGLSTPAGMVLLSDGPVEFGFDASAIVTADMSDGGTLSSLMIDGEVLTDRQMDRLDGGTLGAAFTLRDETLVSSQTGLDEIAADLISRFQNAEIDPTLETGQAGLLTATGEFWDGSETVGLAAQIAVNQNVLDDVSLIRDGIGAETGRSSGDATQIDRWLSGLSQKQTLASGGAAETAAGHAANFASQISAARVTAEDNLAYASARYDALREAELSDGVDTDYELQSLLSIEQAYAANARLIQAVDGMLQQLMEI